jgi:hypothetical protein
VVSVFESNINCSLLLALAYLRSLIGEGNYIQEPVVCVSESRLYLTSASLDKPLCDAFFSRPNNILQQLSGQNNVDQG